MQWMNQLPTTKQCIHIFFWRFCKTVSAKTKGEMSAEQAGARMLSHWRIQALTSCLLGFAHFMTYRKYYTLEKICIRLTVVGAANAI